MNVEKKESKNVKDIEEWFLGALEINPPPVEEMLNAVAKLVKEGETSNAVDMIALLIENEGKEFSSIVKTKALIMMSELSVDGLDVMDFCRKALDSFVVDRLEREFLKAVDFDSSNDLRESLRRFFVLIRLSEGSMCFDKTWGFGIVKKIDDFYRKIFIDFKRKPGHQMSFSYAAETLELISSDHLLAIEHNDPERLASLIKKSPEEVVEITLKSYGELSAVMLKDRLVDVEGILSESDWKRFWDLARKKLKANPLIDLPAKRNDPIRLLSSVEDFLNERAEVLRKERDPEVILKLADDIYDEADEAITEIMAERISFGLNVVKDGDVGLFASYLIFVINKDISIQGVEIGTMLENFLDRSVFMRAADSVNAVTLRALLSELYDRFQERTIEMLVELIPEMPVTILNETMDFLQSQNHGSDGYDAVASLFRQKKASIQVVGWVAKNFDLVISSSIASAQDIIHEAIYALTKSYSGDSLRASNQLQKLLEKREWLEGLLKALTEEQRAIVIKRLNAAVGFDESLKRTIIGRIIKLYPSLVSVMTASVEKESEGGRRMGRFTSWRSFRARCEQHKHIIEKDIPDNSKEIAVALSYGDLRENAEFKAAKEHQGLLYKRRDELDADIKAVKGSDFKGFSTETAGMGTRVLIQRPSKKTFECTILGEWDRDEKLNIISCKSRLAEMLTGATVNSEVLLPTEDGDENCIILEINNPSDEVMEWCK